jgi:hypothetical protein
MIMARMAAMVTSQTVTETFIERSKAEFMVAEPIR